MTNARRRLRLMMLCLLLFLAAVAALNWLANPYGAWSVAVIDPIYRIPESARNEPEERIITAYHLRTEQPATLLVGSSRVLWGIPIGAGDEHGFFNAGLCGASLAEIAAVLRLARAKPGLTRVIWGVDFYAFDEKYRGFRYPETRAELEGDGSLRILRDIRETLLNAQAFQDSRRVLWKAIRGQGRLDRVPVPWPEPTIEADLEHSEQDGLARTDEAVLEAQVVQFVAPIYTDYRPSAPLLSLFRSTIAAARDAGIELALFIPPLSECELEVIRQRGQWDTFREWKRQVAATQPYWDYSGYNALAYADDLFRDAVHFKPAVGHLILRHLLGEDTADGSAAGRRTREAGVWVDAATVEQHLAQQQAALEARLQQDSRYRELVATALRK
jgi:hypothetical protein